VRELRNAIERALILETGREVQAASLPDFQADAHVGKATAVQVAVDESLDEAVSRLERELINHSLAQHSFSLTRTAERLKLTRHSLRYRMQRLGISAGESAEESGVAETETANV
jgi:DNA-binding NtrC family response regulator